MLSEFEKAYLPQDIHRNVSLALSLEERSSVAQRRSYGSVWNLKSDSITMLYGYLKVTRPIILKETVPESL